MNEFGLAGRPRRDVAMGITLIAMMLLLAGCGGAQARAERSRHATLIDPADVRKLGYNPQWPADLYLTRGESLQHVVFSDGIILAFARPHNVLTAISYDNGSTLWHRAVGTEVEQFHEPFRARDRVMINSGRRLFQFSPSDGELLYVSNLDYPVSHRPVIIDTFAIYGGGNGRIFAHDMISGFAKWRYQLPTEIRVGPVMRDDLVFAADAQGIYAALDGNNGRLMWKNRTFGAVTGKLAMGDLIYVASHDQALYALERLNGTPRWVFRDDMPLREGPTLMGNYLFQPLVGRGMVVLNAADGRELWRMDQRAQPVKIEGERLLLNMGRALRVVDVTNGELIEEVPTRPLKIVLHDRATGNIVLVTEAGQMLRLDRSR